MKEDSCVFLHRYDTLYILLQVAKKLQNICVSKSTLDNNIKHNIEESLAYFQANPNTLLCSTSFWGKEQINATATTKSENKKIKKLQQDII